MIMYIHKGTRWFTKDIILDTYAIPMSLFLHSQHTTCMLGPKTTSISLLLFHTFSKLGKACFRPWSGLASGCLSSWVLCLLTAVDVGWEKLLFCQTLTYLSEMLSLLLLSWNQTSLQLVVNVWFKKWVLWRYCSTSKLLHSIVLCIACSRTHFPVDFSQIVRGLCPVPGELRSFPLVL